MAITEEQFGELKANVSNVKDTVKEIKSDVRLLTLAVQDDREALRKEVNNKLDHHKEIINRKVFNLLFKFTTITAVASGIAAGITYIAKG